MSAHINISIVNIDTTNDLDLDIADIQSHTLSAQVATSQKFTDHNTLTGSETIKPQPFNGAKKAKQSLTMKLPAKSIVMIKLAK